ncbi:MAG TPA: TetR/AcrR family transcriptional regulator [Novosphingobium sp.]
MKSVVAQPRPETKKKVASPKAAKKKSDVTRQRVLEATAELFRTNGYLATSMRDIAGALGMKSGSLYYYYDSKEALLAAILNDAIDAHISAMKAALEALPAGASARQKFDAAVEVSVKMIWASGDMAVASTQTLSFLQEPEYSEQVRHRQAYNQFWRDLIEEGKRNGEIRKDFPDAVASMVIVGALTFVAEWYDPQRATTHEIGALFSRLLFEGMRA